MSTKADWLPSKHEEVKIQADRTQRYLYVEENQVRMGFSGTNLDFLLNVFGTSYILYRDMYRRWENPADRTPRITSDFLASEKEFKTIYRRLYMGYLKYNPNVLDSDLEEMGLPKRTSGRTPVPVPDTFPVFEMDTSTIRRVRVLFHDAGKTNKAKPVGIHGAEIGWIVSDVPVTEIKDLLYSSFKTHSPYTFEFEDSQRGKHLYLALCWENTRGEKGPWSEIANAIIP